MSYPLYAATMTTTWNGTPVDVAEQTYLEIEHRPAGVLLDFTTPFYNDPPPPLLPEADIVSTPELWNYEVVELFIKHAHSEQYTEMELGPHGNYLVLRLNGVRQRVSEGHPLRYKSYLEAGHWMGTALLEHAHLPPRPWVFNAYRIHGTEPGRRYLSLFSQPATDDAPDFHRLETFKSLEFGPSPTP